MHKFRCIGNSMGPAGQVTSPVEVDVDWGAQRPQAAAGLHGGKLLPNKEEISHDFAQALHSSAGFPAITVDM